jgi:hypothetical protein
MTERPGHHPLLIAMVVVCAVVIVVGAAIELTKGDGSGRSITEHAGTLHWTPKSGDPDPELGARHWTMAYPAAYASRVHSGVGIYVGDKRIGFVQESKVDQGSVWVYAWIAPQYARIAEGVTESEPIETPEGPRVQIYKYSKVAPPNSLAA